MLDVKVRHRYGGFHLDAAFAAPTPGVVALFGPSGCGKSTVANAIAGLLAPDEGRIVADGVLFVDTGLKRSMRPERRRIGYVFQDARLFPHLTVSGNLRYGLRRAPEPAPRIGFDQVVTLLGIGHLLHRQPHGLSGGETQRVAIGRALLSQPGLMLMDEPLASLDQARKAEVLPYLERLRDELRLPIVYVSHDWDEVARLADTLVLMDVGRVVASGPLGELASRTDLPLLAGRLDAGSVVQVEVEAHDAARRLTVLSFPGGRLLAPPIDAPVGSVRRVRIDARDVILAGAAPERISVRNVLEATVGAIAELDDAHAMVRVLAGPTPILARLTRDAVAKLGLAPGSPVFVLIKSVALDRGGRP